MTDTPRSISLSPAASLSRKAFEHFNVPLDSALTGGDDMTEAQLRESVRTALTAYRGYLDGLLAEANPDDDRDDLCTSTAQVESAMRVLWMEPDRPGGGRIVRRPTALPNILYAQALRQSGEPIPPDQVVTIELVESTGTVTESWDITREQDIGELRDWLTEFAVCFIAEGTPGSIRWSRAHAKDEGS